MALEENLGSTALIAPSSVLFSIVMLTLHTCNAFENLNPRHIQMYFIPIVWSEIINLLLWNFSFYPSTCDNSGASCTLVHKSFVKIVHIPAYHSIISVQQNYDLNILQVLLVISVQIGSSVQKGSKATKMKKKNVIELNFILWNQSTLSRSRSRRQNYSRVCTRSPIDDPRGGCHACWSGLRSFLRLTTKDGDMRIIIFESESKKM